MSPFTVNPETLRNNNNNPSTSGKTILITGGSSGIGLATAELFLSLSPTNNIALLDLHAPAPTSPLAQPANTHRVLFHKCDVTKWAEQRGGFAATISRFGRLDVVFVNAGIAEYGDQFFRDELEPGTNLLKEPDRRVLHVDLNAAADTVKLAVYWMRKTKDRGAGGGGGDGGQKRTGSIVMTASLAGYLASAGAPVYSAAKHGIVGLMRALKNDTATLGIATSVVAPAITVTPIISSPQRRNNADPKEWADSMAKVGVPINKPQSVALAVAHLVSLGMEANGKGILVQKDEMVDVERGIAKTREVWMGKEMLDLFRGGRTAPLFENKL